MRVRVRRTAPVTPRGVIPTRRPLFPHQEKALDYAYGRDHIGLIMEMRLGKTLATIRWVQELPDRPRCCIVCAPLTVLDAWERELTAEGETFVPCYGLPKNKRLERVKEVAHTRKGQRKWLLINYEGVLATPIIAAVPWDVVVADECTALKNPNAKRSKLFCKGFRDAKHRVILTGLIRPESDEDIFTPMKFLHGSFMGESQFYRWRAKYFRRDWTGRGWVPHPESRALIKDMLHRKTFVMTRSKANMGKKKIYEKRMIDMTPTQRKMYNQAEDEFALMLESGEELETQWAIVMRNWLQHITGGFDPEKNFISAAKKNELMSLLQGELQGQKVVIWCRYRHEIFYLREVFTEAGIGFVSIIGGDPQEERSQKMQQFRKDPHIPVFLATVQVARFGVDVSVADTAIYYSCDFSSENRIQSEDRILHPNKHTPLLYIDLVCRGTCDVDLMDTLREKKLNSALFMTRFINTLQKRRATEYIGRKRAA